MNLRKPAYYDSFRCLAGSCPDSCCQEWDVDVDDASAAYYRSLPGELGDRLRQVLTDTEEGTVMTIEEGRCPMWRRDGLCRIQAELGEQALCQVCRQFPRLRHDYGSFVELGLELSCPEAARLILSSPALPELESSEPGEPQEPEDPQALEILLETRQEAQTLLLSAPSPSRALTLLLLYGCHAQALLDGEEAGVFSPEDALETAAALAAAPDIREFLDFYRHLEILTPRWAQRLEEPHSVSLPEQARPLAGYLISRYWLQAVSDYDLVSRVKFIVSSCLLVGLLGGDYVETAQLFSKEIENDAANVDAILDGAYTVKAFADDRLLGLLQLGDAT